MIIGINGRAGSGKDTVGKIIQDLTCKRTKGYSGILNQEVELIGSSNWQIKKFADKLKDIVCILIGCTRQQLENQTFKETPLGKEWWVYNWRGMNYSKKQYKEEMLPEYQREAVLVKITPRILLQKIGTDFFREQLNPNIWVNSLLNDYKLIYTTESFYDEKANNDSGITNKTTSKYPNWIITDMRFKNEKKRIEELGGISIRVNRKSGILPCVGHEFQHSSENDLDKETFSYTVNNNGSIEDLIEAVREILIKEKIIK